MGQYWLAANLSRREYIDPQSLGAGAKLWEIIANPGLGAALILTQAEVDGHNRGIVGRWAGDRIALVGDYAERGDLAPEDNADLIWHLIGSEDERARAVEHLFQQGEIEAAERLRKAELYRDITPDVAAELGNAPQLGKYGPGWAIANPNRAEVVIPAELGVGSRLEDLVGSLLPGAALAVPVAAQREVRGGGDLDLDKNWHGPERQRDPLKYASCPAPMPAGYSVIAHRTIGRWAGDPVTVTRNWAGYRSITADVLAVLRHELHSRSCLG